MVLKETSQGMEKFMVLIVAWSLPSVCVCERERERERQTERERERDNSSNSISQLLYVIFTLIKLLKKKHKNCFIGKSWFVILVFLLCLVCFGLSEGKEYS
jgi:hypothetical protein